ncbi:hypothetical protein TNCV_1034961 [Trichonephila clavipes]|nr:hypothetical protein TNCV_1034961 [Trichonephila clavipes]
MIPNHAKVTADHPLLRDQQGAVVAQWSRYRIMAGMSCEFESSTTKDPKLRQRYQANGSHCEEMAVLPCPKPIPKDSLRRHQSTTHGCPFVQTTSESSSRIREHRYSEKENAASTSHATNDDENTQPIKLSNSTRKKVFNCFECGKVFYQRNSLNQHVKTVHASSTSFLCPVCNKNCVTVHGLITHLKIHTTNGEENVPSTSTVNNPRQMEVGNIPLSNSFPLIQSAFKS